MAFATEEILRLHLRMTPSFAKGGASGRRGGFDFLISLF